MALAERTCHPHNRSGGNAGLFPGISFRSFIVFITFSIIAIYASCRNVILTEKPPRAEQGILDLREWSFQENGSVPLSGQWEFYWNSLLTPSDFRKAERPVAPVFFTVPGTWNRYRIDGKTLGGKGFATFRLKVITGGENEDMALSIKTVSTAMRLYVDGAEVTSTGNVGRFETESVPAYHSHIVHVGALPREFDIIMQVSNYHYRSGGPWRAIRFGRYYGIHNTFIESNALSFIFFGGILIMALYHLTMYCIRRNDIHFFLFSVFCLLVAVRGLATGDYLIEHLAPSIPFHAIIRIEYLSYMLAIPVFGWFSLELFGDYMSKIAIYSITAVSCLFAIAVCVTPVFIFTHFIMPYNAVAIASCLYYISALIVASLRRHQDSRIFLIGFIILFLAFINDYLHNSFIIQTLNTIDAGLFMFIFTQAYTLSRRFTRAFNDIEFMSMELRDLNINQEQIIQQRTGELLEKQRQIERQLQLARSIQQSLIPDVSGSMQNIRMKAVYLPLDEVGGDFYDVIRIDDTRIGIFLADVSGHGVPAAMIASMVKSFINLHAHSGYGSEEFLTSLNRLLFPMIHSYFVTCFYGILSTKTQSIEFCLAGHPPPVLVHVNGETETLSAKGTAIGFRANPVLETRSVKFRAGERIYLYSDGVTEAFSPDGEMFGTSRLTELMVDHRTLEIGDALNNIITKVREFQNKESFNDDLTMLVIEAI